MQTQKGHALFYSVDDWPTYKKLKLWLPGQHPGLKFAFLGDTFADWSRWRPGQKAGLDPTTRLLWKWVIMNEQTVKVIKPALYDPQIDLVIIHRFGRFSYHYATKYVDCPNTLPFHEHVVKARVLEQGVSPPEYYDKLPSDARILRADEAYTKNRTQKIVYLHANTPEGRCEEFNRLITPRLQLIRPKRQIAA